MGGLCSAVPMARFSTATAGTTGSGIGPTGAICWSSPRQRASGRGWRYGALLKEQLGPSPSEVDVAMKRGLEALLW